MYYVAFCDNWCSVVPKNWIDKESSLISWPPKNENATTACKKSIKPKSSWNYLKFTKLLGPYDSYNIARQIEIAAVDLSTCDEASFTTVGKETTVSSKRPRKRPTRYEKTSEEESSEDKEIDDNLSSEGEVSDGKFKYVSTKNVVADDDLETQPLEYGSFFDDPAYDELKEQEERTNKLSVVKDQEEKKKKVSVVNMEIRHVPSSHSKNCKSPESSDTGAKGFVEEKNDDNGTEDNNNNNITQKLADNSNLDPENHTTFKNIPPAIKNCESCCRACRLKLDQMDRKIDIILQHIASKNSVQASSTSSISALPEFTIKNYEALKQFNKMLIDNEEARTQYITLITLREKPEGKKHVREVLGYILDNSFSCKLSWSGQKKTISVKEMAFVKILTSAVINCNPRNTITEINNAIMSWLQHAIDRVKYANNKHEALNNQN